ncbi:MAG TPA: hypothetical protein VII72_04705 [Myxococcota bacterium]|jgi:hypothetical protein
MKRLLSTRLATVAVVAFIAQSARGQVAEFQALAPHAAGLMLAEVESIAVVDDRPRDGCMSDLIRLRVVKATGESRDSISVAISCSWALGDAPAKAPVARGDLVPGRTYWFSVASRHQGDRVDRWWPGDGPHRAVFEAAIARDALAGHPQYDPASGLTYSRTGLSGNRWRIQVEKDGGVLWSRLISGERSSRYGSWHLYRRDSFGDDLDPSGLGPSVPVLAAETSTSLAGANEFGLPPGTYYARHLFDGRSGAPVAMWISEFQPGEVERLFRVFQVASQKVVLERRQLWFPKGGLAIGSDREGWLRRVVRVLDTSRGEWSERTYRHGSVSCGENCLRSAWIEIAPATR